MAVCAMSPDDKRTFGKVVGDDLLRHHGKRPYYTVREVKISFTLRLAISLTTIARLGSRVIMDR
jgi:hypothetical protein